MDADEDEKEFLERSEVVIREAQSQSRRAWRETGKCAARAPSVCKTSANSNRACWPRKDSGKEAPTKKTSILTEYCPGPRHRHHQTKHIFFDQPTALYALLVSCTRPTLPTRRTNSLSPLTFDLCSTLNPPETSLYGPEEIGNYYNNTNPRPAQKRLLFWGSLDISITEYNSSRQNKVAFGPVICAVAD